jgi:predicted amidohydrolase YtcJ
MKPRPILGLYLLILLLGSACGTSSATQNGSPVEEGAPVMEEDQAVLTPELPNTPREISPDYIFYNGTIITMDATRPEVEAIAVQGDTIIALGSSEQMLELGKDDSDLIDLDGLTLTPGFIDSHSHRMTGKFKWGFSAIGRANQEVLTQGWTGLDELVILQHDLNELLEAEELGQLDVRLNLYLGYNDFDGNLQGDWYKAYQPGQQLTPHLRIAGIKVFIDFDSGRTFFFEQEELNQLIDELHSEGWQVSMKAVSIQSHELALVALDYALQGQTNEEFRHRLEHSVGVTDEQMAWMAERGIIACIQPGLPGVMSYDPDITRMAEENGYENSYRWREYIQNGVFVVASPLNPPNAYEEQLQASHMSPSGAMYRGVTQIAPENQKPEPWMLEKTLSVEQMFPLFTINGAYTTFEEEFKGSLTPGKWADLVILSGNPLSVPVEDLPDITALMTMIGGEIVYCREGYEGLCGTEPTGTVETETAPGNTVSISAGSPIKIAVQGPVSGGSSNLYEPLQNTVQLAIEDYGLISDEFSIELIPVDDQCDQNAAAEAAEGLIREHPDVVGVIGPLCSSGVLGARSDYQEISLVSISGSNTREDLSQLFGEGGYNRTIFHDGQTNQLGISNDFIYELEPVLDFYAGYENQFGPISVDVKLYLPYTYDATLVLLTALDEIQTRDEEGNLVVDRAPLASTIRSIEIEGITGSIQISETGDRVPNSE